jgi:DNA-binding SARP family transcriptional activator
MSGSLGTARPRTSPRPAVVPAGAVDCRTFGELTVHVGDVAVDLGGPKQRLLLALLLCRANSVVGVDELTEALWSDEPPRTARKNIQVYISKLRKVFGDRLTHVGRGYRLRVGPADCDLTRFEQLARGGRQEGGVDQLAQAIALWGERPFAEFGDEHCLAAEVDRRHELFLSALEDWAELEIDRGNHRDVLTRLADHIRPHALRERLGAAWMRALGAAGRGNEALAHFEFVRRALADELGVDPGPALTRVHGNLLRGEPSSIARTSLGNQLPRDLTDFVGRTGEIHQVVENFAAARGHDVVVVSGPVGAGKSAFAVHVAHLLADAFPDGTLILDLRAADGTAKSVGDLLAELLDMVGLRCEQSPSRALAVWRSWLAGRRVLLVLDNATGEDVVRTLLPGGGGAIVTSWNRLSGLESVLRVDLPALSESESMELMGRIIGHGRVLADARSAREILGYCEGSPLAVRITGAKLAALRHVRLADYLERLRRSGCLLDEMAVGGLAVRARYESFYRNLSELQREGFRRVVRVSAPFEHGRLVEALGDLGSGGESALEALFECNLLSVPDCEVTAHCASYGMSVFAGLLLV